MTPAQWKFTSISEENDSPAPPFAKSRKKKTGGRHDRADEANVRDSLPLRLKTPQMTAVPAEDSLPAPGPHVPTRAFARVAQAPRSAPHPAAPSEGSTPAREHVQARKK